MRIAPWPCAGNTENALRFGGDSSRRVLILSALFDEHNKLRRFTTDLMRALEAAGVASVLPDLPGCNESLAPLTEQTISGWREAAGAAARHFEATEVLTIRGGALLAPGGLPLTQYAPVASGTILRGLLRAAVLSEREAGREVTREALLARGLREGLVLAGYSLSAAMLAELEASEPGPAARMIAQSEVGGPSLWLRAEPGDDAEQAARLAGIVAQLP